jgi:NAD+ synthase (glutamine-hydrolysing)
VPPSPSAAEPVVVFPELTLSGYPPEDLLLRPSLGPARGDCLPGTSSRPVPPTAWVVVGYPLARDGRLYNCAGCAPRRRVIAEYRKRELPNYQVFDEKRYFSAGDAPCVVDIQGRPRRAEYLRGYLGDGTRRRARHAAGAELLINLNASPYHRGKQDERLQLVCRRAVDNALAIVYVNQVGGQDELVFDGGSFAVDADGLRVGAPRFEEAATWCEVACEEGAAAARISAGELAAPLPEIGRHLAALVIGVRDYVNKNGFPGVVLGLSGGVDSALTLAVAVDALGRSASRP